MKAITPQDHKEEYAEIIQGLFVVFTPSIAWQNTAAGERKLYQFKIQDVNNEKESLLFVTDDDTSHIQSNEIIFVFSDELKALFKANVAEALPGNVSIEQPKEVLKLDESDLKKYENLLKDLQGELKAGVPELSLDLDEEEAEDVALPSAEETSPNMWMSLGMNEHDANLIANELSYITLDEEDKMFEGMRAAPRAKPPEGKMVTLQSFDSTKAQVTLSLYDLSQGGLSFLVFAKDDFEIGEKIYIKAFDINKFETPMIAEIKAIREADDLGIQYKVGCQFLDLGNIQTN